MDVHFIDTSVFLNIIDVPGRNQQKAEVMTELSDLVQKKAQNALILPFATIVETGNHISHCSNGNERRTTAKRFVDYIVKTVRNEAPWIFYSEQFSEQDLLNMCKDFPDAAMREISFGDVSIIQAYNKFKKETIAVRRIRIWSVDSDLRNKYDEMMTPVGLRNG